MAGFFCRCQLAIIIYTKLLFSSKDITSLRGIFILGVVVIYIPGAEWSVNNTSY